MRRPPGVDECHAVTLLLQVVSGPRTKHASTNDRDMILHLTLVGLCERRRNGSAARSDQERAARYFEYIGADQPRSG